MTGMIVNFVGNADFVVVAEFVDDFGVAVEKVEFGLDQIADLGAEIVGFVLVETGDAERVVGIEGLDFGVEIVGFEERSVENVVVEVERSGHSFARR